jgi:hypothetical protein
MWQRFLGFLLGCVAPVVMLFAAIVAIPDYFRVRRLRRM